MTVFYDILRKMTNALCRGDGVACADCFCPDGIYHDCFYGDFVGRDIENLVTEHAVRDGENYRWDLLDPVTDGAAGYSRYLFSYDSKIESAATKRIVFEGISFCKLQDGLIAEYHEIANHIVALPQLNFPDERILKFLSKETSRFLERSDCREHLAISGRAKT